MSADVLRRAAALMRERAEAATPGPWERVTHPRFGPQGAVRTPNGDLNISAYTEPYRSSEDALHIASWHPTVALAVADWLDHEAGYVEAHQASPDGTTKHALDVARAYLGEQP